MTKVRFSDHPPKLVVQCQVWAFLTTAAERVAVGSSKNLGNYDTAGGTQAVT